MSTKLSAEQLAEIPKAHEGAMRCACYEYDCGCVALLMTHCTALDEELKAAQERIAELTSRQNALKGYSMGNPNL